MLVPLRALITLQDRNNLRSSLGHFLSSFSCIRDKDIEYFLHHRAIDFEKASKSRTFLICRENTSVNTLSILAYFTLAMKTLRIPSNMSVNKRRKFDGYSGKIHNKPIEDITCFLIGQLGRNSNFNKTDIRGYDIIKQAFAIINFTSLSIGGRWILIECRDNPKLIEFYAHNGFQYFMTQPDEDKPYGSNDTQS